MNIPMEIRPYGAQPIRGHFTNEHAASSYGQPVFVADDGTAYGPGDIDKAYGEHLHFVGEPSPGDLRAAKDYLISVAGQPICGLDHRGRSVSLLWEIPRARTMDILPACEAAAGRRIARNH